ncbi:cholesterol 25-hydroxylase-like protein [Megalops cyprinoides]|uniref:cholesterol 25-hydroxylase-like protein n=1 Tax=Megalops cyprinoides TaxID=118141 RepID=UPI001863F852|nr:cholesterol 25-hydroxylase-like protein [Megalops cyprinoides]
MNNTCGLSDLPDGHLLQPVWDHLRRRQELLLSPYLPASFALLAHLLFCAPFLALDVLGHCWPAVHRFRIAGSSTIPVCLRRWFDCFVRILLKYLTCVIPATALLQQFRTRRLPAVAPSCCQALWEIILCLLLFDTFFYFWHIIVHRVPWLYQWVHRTHHYNWDTFALVAQDASRTELLSLQILALSSAAVVGCHPLSEIFFHLLNTWLAVEDHCGYDLPWALHHFLPGVGGAPFHQLHHQKFRGNYAPYFKHWDQLCGTYLTEEVT